MARNAGRARRVLHQNLPAHARTDVRSNCPAPANRNLIRLQPVSSGDGASADFSGRGGGNALDNNLSWTLISTSNHGNALSARIRCALRLKQDYAAHTSSPKVGCRQPNVTAPQLRDASTNLVDFMRRDVLTPRMMMSLIRPVRCR